MSEQIWVTDALKDLEQVYHFNPTDEAQKRIFEKRLDRTYLNAELVLSQIFVGALCILEICAIPQLVELS